MHSLSRRADSLFAQGRYKEAESLYRQALALAETIFGFGHSDTVTFINNLAVIYKYTAHFDEARRLYRRALLITEKSLGPDHSQAATLWHNLGGIEHAAGDFAHPGR